MAKKSKEEEWKRMIQQIDEWNANRLDLFELSRPNEDLEFHGVMRFFYQDTSSKVATKCIRVASSATTQDVTETLIEKFRPDMRMLSLPNYSLYEVHVNGEERKLQATENPLLVQLNWGKDDREGRFLLKSEDVKTAILGTHYDNAGNPITPNDPAALPAGPGFKRKLSKREKKEAKKKEKGAKSKGKENFDSPSKGDESVAEKLYHDLPETSFTRTISNPEVVMRRRRQQKLEKKLQQIRSPDGGPDSGGTLKIYGESLVKGVPYKTLLLSISDTAAYIVKETLDKYGLDKEDPHDYCLVQVHVPSEYHGDGHGPEVILEDGQCPLTILMQHPPSKGTIMFQLKKRKRRKGDSRYGSESHLPPEKLPYLTALNSDGSELPKPKKHRLGLNVTEVGSERSMSKSGHLQLFGPNIQPRHCVIAHTEDIVTVTPCSREAETYVNGNRIYETTILQHGMTVRFGRHHAFRFCVPMLEDKDQMMRQGMGDPSMRQHQLGPHGDMGETPNTFETTFDVDGHIETVTSPLKDEIDPRDQRDYRRPTEHAKRSPNDPYGSGPPSMKSMGRMEDMLPAFLEFREEGEDAFLAAVISEVNGGNVQFKLSPTYTIYLAARYRLSRNYRPDMGLPERAHRLGMFLNKVASMCHQTIQENRNNAASLSFWMANASEILHFIKQDRDIGQHSLDAQDILAEAVQIAFKHLTMCLQEDLRHVMPAFLHDRDDDDDEDNHITDNGMDPRGRYPTGRPTLGEVMQTLSSAMTMLRRCRVNAALTIQLFSQLFHFVNMWLFNKLVCEPHLQLCTRMWGLRLKRRLARIEAWAEKQGLELAADCHLCRIIQAAHLLQAPKSGADDIASISSTCFKLNSLQLRALLQNYIPMHGEPRIPQDLIDSVVAVAESTADELTRTDGRDVRLEEDPDLQLPFLLPEDGYSCDIIRGVPAGLPEFLDILIQSGICRFRFMQAATGMWTIYMPDLDTASKSETSSSSPKHDRPEPFARPNIGSVQREVPMSTGEVPLPPGLPKDPEVITVSFNKVSGSMGLSIVAARGEGQKERGIYVKTVVTGGAAALDGRLQAGDQLLEVDGKSLIGLTQEKAAEFMTRTGFTVTLKVAKQGAIYHGLATLLSQPSPVMERASPRRAHNQGPQGGPKEVPHMNGAKEVSPARQLIFDAERRDQSAYVDQSVQEGKHRPHHLGQVPARSSPSLNSQSSEGRARMPDDHGAPYRQNVHTGSHSQLRQEQQRGDPSRSKSIPNLKNETLDHNANRPVMSTSTLPRMHHPQRQEPPGGQINRQTSHPDLNTRRDNQQRPNNRDHGHDNRMMIDNRNYVNTENDPRGSQNYMNHPRGDPRQHYVNFDYRNQEIRPHPGAQQPRDFIQQQRGAPPGMMHSDRPPMREDRPSMRDDRSRDQRPHSAMYQQERPENEPFVQGRPRSEFVNQARLQEYEQRHRQSSGSSLPPDTRQQPHFHDPRNKEKEPSPPFGQVHRPEMADQSATMKARPNIAVKPGEKISPQEASYMQAEKRHPQGAPPQSNIKPSPTGPQHVRDYERKSDSPDLPPPPDMPPDLPPPPVDMEDNLPPPPPPPTEYEPLHHGQGPPKVPGPGSYQPPQRSRDYENQPFERTGQRPEPQSSRPGNQPQHSYGSQRIQGYDGPQGYNREQGYRQPSPADNRPSQMGRMPEPQQPAKPHQDQYDRRPGLYRRLSSEQEDVPTKQWAKELSAIESESQRRWQSQGQLQPQSRLPPTGYPAGQPVINKDSQGPASPSPWQKEEKERARKQHEEEIKRIRDLKIAELQNKPYLNPQEEEKLRKLRLDQEFQRRVEEIQDKGGEESDHDMSNRAQGREAMLRMMQEDVEKSRLRIAQKQNQRRQDEQFAEMERVERQDRMLQQLEEERERQIRKQQKKEQEQTQWLNKQKELREQQRQEVENSRRLQMEEEEKIKQRQMEEVRQKREREQQQLREMQLKAEERIREEQRRREEERIREEQRRRDEQFSQQRFNNYNQYGGFNPEDERNFYGGHEEINAPPPPERKSSYDLLSQNQYRPGYGAPSASEMYAKNTRPGAMPVQDQGGPKKSVSFDSKLTEISGYTDNDIDSVLNEQPQQAPTLSSSYAQQNNYTEQQTTPQNSRSVDSMANYANVQPSSPLYTAGATPGVIGAQEVYHDPRSRIAASRHLGAPKGPGPETMSFRDKMKLFASEAGENTPQEKSKSSRAQMVIERSLHGVNGQ